jgi:glyoxylase-like metal-dependent hydrolase (beta-lactamase superfamily II)
LKGISKRGLAAAAAVAMGVAVSAGAASTAPSDMPSVDRLYVFDCGVGHAADQSRWSPGVNVGQPIDISVSCYLLQHGRDYFLWDTGISDHVASMPDGWLRGTNPAVDIHWRRAKTLVAQLAELKLTPADIRMVGISHTHPDHAGNAELFPAATIVIQKTEYDTFFAQSADAIRSILPPGDPTPPLAKSHPTKQVDEDLDVFGDGSVMIVWTPGHTPGHQSCLVHLRRTGWVLLSGDAVHLQTNWDNRRLPYFNRLSTEAKFQTALSMQRMADLMSFYKAQLWIVHDKAQSDRLKHAPAYYE